jgi:hypothetical protein
MEGKSETNAAKRGGHRRGLLIGGIIAICALLCVVGYMGWLLTHPAAVPVPEEEDILSRSRLVTEDNVEEVVRAMEAPPTERPGAYEVTMTTDWNFPDGASISPDAFVENAVSNTNDVYFDLLLEDTEEVIYESPIIPLGAKLTEIQLSKPLDAGTYPCVIEYHLVNSRQQTLGTLRMGLTIHVNG